MILTEKPYILGVDPGYSGALAIYSMATKTLVTVVDMPITIAKAQGKSKKKTRIDLEGLSFFLDIHKNQIRGAVIEEVGSMPDQGVVSVFNFGFSTGVLHGAISGAGIPIVTAKPAVWKQNLNLNQDKNRSRSLAAEQFPEHGTKFQRVKDDGRAEAALLAKYGERIFL